METEDRPNRILIHLGPHKTGSTSLQSFLRTNSSTLLEKHSIQPIVNDTTERLAHAISTRRMKLLPGLFREFEYLCQQATARTIILSQEDFSGNMMGRGRCVKAIERFDWNVTQLEKNLGNYDLEFIFVIREREDWLRSLYKHHAYHRPYFASYEDFKARCETDFEWEPLIAPTRNRLGGRFHTLRYDGEDLSALPYQVLEIAGVPQAEAEQLELPGRLNAASEPDLVEKYEFVNRLYMDPRRKIRLKSLIRNNPAQSPPKRSWFASRRTGALSLTGWRPGRPDWIDPKLAPLLERAATRIPVQEATDILPATGVALRELAFTPVVHDPEVDISTLSRKRMEDQLAILKYHFRNSSELALLNALTISYLRRDTPHTAKAKKLFMRMWSEMGAFLRIELPSRWLISVLQTFHDHGENEAQRMIGMAGFFYGNLVKAYEAEASLDGLEADRIYAHTEPATRGGFETMDRFAIGRTDLLTNINTMAADLCQRDEAAGQVLAEFLMRTRNSSTLFSRADRTRREKEVDATGFEDCWSFGAEPE
ncbi:hypothetical protein KHP62_15160 [Rhodobacteraceae bacterium NNCM2]|nr:hypothetical protein [Coraliihabitans acroporae]